MKKLFLFIPLLLVIFCSWQQPKTLKGKWQFVSGVYNGKKDTATTEYTLRRNYDKDHFEAFITEPGEKPVKYQAGDYTLQGDTCLETETFSTQPSNLTHKTIHYYIQLRHDTLILSGKLPTGMEVEEYWKKIK
ncbi:hypothetical protein [Mucilaginibacter agri]|uniref:Lipocalin-like domain-containing protein n=1 Tax=Mucilaginibacter agri TaxID=2695265 RepID=A0A965ZIY8_9SPHI|nr:hypothetical protein [Mucilaginibacter agri]NCD71955.1 hypothetical protein [Mucilaginibacter agri]